MHSPKGRKKFISIPDTSPASDALGYLLAGTFSRDLPKGDRITINRLKILSGPPPADKSSAIAVAKTDLLDWFKATAGHKMWRSFTLGPAPQLVPQPALETFWQEEPVVGWRAWNLVTQSDPLTVKLTLKSVFHEVYWEPRVPHRAHCQRAPHEGPAPEPGCLCGIYAFRTPEDLDLELMKTGLMWSIVVGRIAMWGRTLQCARGWRSQYAYPLDLRVTGMVMKMHEWRAETARQLQERYRVPVTAVE